jgi:hypothetical protein
VCAPSLYSSTLKTTLDITGSNAHRQYNIVIKLKKSMRQKNSSDPKQNQFIDLIPRSRNGDATIEDWKLLLTRISNKKILNNLKMLLGYFQRIYHAINTTLKN